MESLRNLLQRYPEIAIFLTLGIGFLVGKQKFGKFSLGVVTSTLLAGILIGQLDTKIQRLDELDAAQHISITESRTRGRDEQRQSIFLQSDPHKTHHQQ